MDRIAYYDALAVVSALPMLWNTALSCVPTIVTAAMITTEMSAAIRPYSIAVAPLSSRSKRLINIVMTRLQPTVQYGSGRYHRASIGAGRVAGDLVDGTNGNTCGDQRLGGRRDFSRTFPRVS